MKRVLIVSPHPDDETLGCGGTILKHKDKGDLVNWLVVTGIKEGGGFTPERIVSREGELKQIEKIYEFNGIDELEWPTTKLDVIPMSELVYSIAAVIRKLKPHIIYIPYPGDAHSDHRIVFDATVACTKWFRHESIERILVYETLSETEFGLNPDSLPFRPNVFVDVSSYIDKKIKAMRIYSTELGEFPFPRSEQTIRALASLRGSTAGCQAAEAFMLLKEIL